MFEPVTNNIFRWGTIDPELSIMIFGHLLIENESVVLIDPPAVPNLEKMSMVLGKPKAVIMTNFSHTRGCVKVARSLNVPLYIPDVTGSKDFNSDEKIKMFRLDSGIRYGEESDLPLGIKPHHIRSEVSGRLVVEEMALRYGSFLIVGDSAWGTDGKLNVFPAGVMPDENGEKSTATKAILLKIVKNTGVTGLLSGHGEDITEGLQQMVGL